jgi:chromosome segregation ATPase
LRGIVERALAPDPKDRYATAAAVANELQAYLSQQPTTFDRTKLSRFRLWCRRNPQLALSIGVAIGLLALVAGTHWTLVNLREERDALDQEVGAATAEQAKLNASVTQTERQLDETRTKLAAERENLATLEKSLADERSNYEALISAKEQALVDATTSTRRLMEQLEAMRRQRQEADSQRANLEKSVAEMRRDVDRAARDRERAKKERETARLERDRVQHERDEAVRERDALIKELELLKRQRK